MISGYRDRGAAGAVLAVVLQSLAATTPILLALPRGGVAVAAPVAEELAAPLGVVVVGKIGAPGHAELAMGAVAVVGESFETFRNTEVVAGLGVSEETFARLEAAEIAEARRRILRWNARAVALAGRTVLLVDDGLATGSTMMAAVQAVRARQPERVVVAVPVGSERGLALVRSTADEVVCPLVPARFGAVGAFYGDFTQTTDEEVAALLAEHGQ